MLSAPPATTTSASPHFTACAASITAFRPEPQTLFTVTRRHRLGQPGLDRGLPRGVHAEPRLQDAAEHDLVHLVRPARRRGATRLAHGDRAQLDRGDVLEGAAERPDGRAAAGEDDGVVVAHDAAHHVRIAAAAVEQTEPAPALSSREEAHE